VDLTETELQDFCEAERVALQRVALEELNMLSLGCHIQIPKDGSRRGLLKRGINLRRSFGLIMDKDRKKDMPSAAVFGQQLSKVLSHDRGIAEKASTVKQNCLMSSSLSSTSDTHINSKMSMSSVSDVQANRKVSSSMSSASDVHVSGQSSPSPPLQPEPIEETDSGNVGKPAYLFSLPRSASMDNTVLTCRRGFPTNENKLRTRSEETESEPTVLHLSTFQSTMTALTQAENISTDRKPEIQLSPALTRRRKSSAPDGTRNSGSYEMITLSPLVDPVSKDDEKLLAYSPLPTQVPLILSRSIKFLEEHGLHTVGLFRVPGSQKRIRQLRYEFDSGRDVCFSDDLNPTDVAGLLKAFLRDLPEPLLTKELYSPFIATRRIEDTKMRLFALNLLCALLPPANRDTLAELLQFLQMVSAHANCMCASDDVTSEEGCGNKMDDRNLATVIGPNILHKMKVGKEFRVMSRNQAEDQDEVISVVEEMVEWNRELFKVSPELHSAVLKKLLDSEPEAVDYLLKKKCLTYEDDVDELMHLGLYSRAHLDDSVFPVDYPRGHPIQKDHFSPEQSSIVLCNPVARGSSGSLPQSGSEAHDVDSLSSDCMSPLEISPYPTSSAPELSNSVTQALYNGHFPQWSRKLSYSQSSPTLDRYSTSSTNHRPVQKTSSASVPLVPASSPVVTVITPASPDMRRRNKSQSSLLRMKGSLDLRSSSEEDIPSLAASHGDVAHEDSVDGSGTFHDENVTVETAKSDNSPVPGRHQFPWQNIDYDWRGDVDLLEQETLV
jgi:hypothetical protein